MRIKQSLRLVANVLPYVAVVIGIKFVVHTLGLELITRIHTIRETDFVFSGYFIASTSTMLLIAGMVVLQIEPFYESVFFLGLVTYLLRFLLRLIRDLDNPFGQYDTSSCEDVSTKLIDDAVARIAGRLDSVVAAS